MAEPHTLPERQRPSENPFDRFSDGLCSLPRLRGKAGALPLRLRLRAGKRFCKPPPPPQPSPARAQEREQVCGGFVSFRRPFPFVLPHPA
ncbi:hypothetical protein [Kingella potus]|uniref:hypothetical protein n=1 Tax=Kingella potus TaxID=265175 RepID=UPI001FD62E7E|nr:hypothetical protein [Kingella potus]UOP00726.1 hypothetical protein LVJ84_13225 [Kingella potus]